MDDLDQNDPAEDPAEDPAADDEPTVVTVADVVAQLRRIADTIERAAELGAQIAQRREATRAARIEAGWDPRRERAPKRPPDDACSVSDGVAWDVARLERALTTVTQERALAMLSVSRPTLRRWVAEQKIGCTKQGKEQRYQLADVMALAASYVPCPTCLLRMPPGSTTCGRHDQRKDQGARTRTPRRVWVRQRAARGTDWPGPGA